MQPDNMMTFVIFVMFTITSATMSPCTTTTANYQNDSETSDIRTIFDNMGYLNLYLNLKEADDLEYDTGDCMVNHIKNQTRSTVLSYYCEDETVFLLAGNNVKILPTAEYIGRSDFDTYIIKKNRISCLNGTPLRNISARSLIIADNDIEMLDGSVFRFNGGLEELTLRKNRIHLNGTQKQLFSYLYNLKKFRFGTNESTLEEDPFLGTQNSWNSSNQILLPSLNTFILEKTTISDLKPNTFLWLRNSTLESLVLRATTIDNVEQDSLKHIQGTLMNLDIANTSISLNNFVLLMESLEDPTAERRSNLHTLSMANMKLSEIPYDALKPVKHSLQALSLYGNNFGSDGALSNNEENTVRLTDVLPQAKNVSKSRSEDVTEEDSLKVVYSAIMRGSHWGTFPPMPVLIELDLRKCNIEFIRDGTFINLKNLKKLYISHNNVLILFSFSFRGLRNLSILDMSYNRFVDEPQKYVGSLYLQKNTFLDLISLRVLNFTNTSIHPGSTIFLSQLPSSLIELLLRSTDITVLEDGTFEKLKNLTMLDLSHNIGLGTSLTSETFVGLDMLQELNMARTSLSDLIHLKGLRKLRILNVRCNNLVSLNDKLSSFGSLETLDLSNNYIITWKSERIFASNYNLRTVYLHFNTLNLLTTHMVKDFQSVSYLSLGHNQFICTCKLKEFILYIFAEDNTPGQNVPLLMDYSEWDEYDYICTDINLSKIIHFNDTDSMCIKETNLILLSGWGHAVYITILIIVAIGCVAGFIYWKWWYIKYFAVMVKNATVLSIINAEDRDERIYIYDIFVSYCDEDKNWIADELLPNLESSNPRPAICLHERDFQVGVSILENIMTGMDQSKSILLVISDSFLKSQWCQFEMHLAQHRLLETCRMELILVLLEDIPRRKRPKILHYLMMTKTYIVWPQDGENAKEKRVFWRRLKKAILKLDRRCSTA